MTILSVENIGKHYAVYRRGWHRYARWFGLPYSLREENWVLRHISFKIEPGEAIGIIGQNGAGKSTLLKLISRVQASSEGAITIAGKVSAVLELGMGFNQELTGRENARHDVALMGYTAKQIDEVMADIEDFSEIGDYFDKPLRTYSSGMQMRVAFSVATAFRPDLLIIDEALSVGDAYFQHKSASRIREFQELGTSLLIVSHDRLAIQGLCNRAILLDDGRIIKDGFPDEVFDYYNALIAEKENSTIKIDRWESGKTKTSSGTKEAVVSSISLLNIKGENVENIGVGDKAVLDLTIIIFKQIPELTVGYMIKDRIGQIIYGTNTYLQGKELTDLKPGETIRVKFEFDTNLGSGSYSVSTALHSSYSHLNNNYEWKELALIFQVINKNEKPFDGCAWLPQNIAIKR